MAEAASIIVEIRTFLSPLLDALEDPVFLTDLLNEMGFDISEAHAQQLVGGVSDAFRDAFDELTPAPGAAPDWRALAQGAFSALRALTDQCAGIVTSDGAEVAVRLFDYLLIKYVITRQPVAYAVLQGLGVITDEAERRSISTDPVAQAARWKLYWAHLGSFVSDNAAWARDVYHWGSAASSAAERFQFERAIKNLVRLSDALDAGLAYLKTLEAAEAGGFVKNAGPTKIPSARLPLFQDELDGFEPDSMPIFANEAGMQVVPFGDLNKPEELGLAFTPYQKGAITAEQELTDTLTLKITLDPTAKNSGTYVALRPTGLEIAGAGAVGASFEFTLSRAKEGEPTILVGEPGATRVEAAEVFASVGGNLDGDLFVAAGAKGLKVEVDFSKDGFLGFLIPKLSLDAGSILMGWRNGRGVYFESGTSLSITIPLDKQLGPVHLYEIGIALGWGDALETTGTVTADARIGPLYAYLDGLGVTIRLVPNQDGLLGRYDPAFEPKLPTAYAIALDVAPISGGGFLAVLDHEYRGALALKFESFGFAAFAILTTTLPGGKPGFSFVASIFGDFVIPLGYGFFLTGLGGLIAINRTVDTDALRDVLHEGQLDSILFPADPIANAPTILDNMAAIFPAREGQYAFGPMARIAFSQPPLIEGKLGVIFEVGREFRLLILGSLGSYLPTRSTALVVLEITFFGEIDFGAGTISFDATLQNSRVLSWAISGDMAARTGWAPRIDHVISFGGLHPRYPRPANLPELRRMSINFGSNNPRVTLTAYQAITLSSLQFGAGAELYAKGPEVPLVGRLAAEGQVSFDALIYFNPFSFEASLAGSLALLVDGKEELGLHFRLTLTGPNEFHIKGKVWATICGIDIDFKIDREWGDKRELPAAVADPVAILRDAIAAAPILEAVAAKSLSDGARFVDRREGEEVRAASPVGGLRFSQRAVPLGIEIEKVGEAQIVGSARSFDLALLSAAGAVGLDPVELDFVRGHFWKMSESERLRAPAFERHKSGFEVSSGDQLVVDTAKGIEVEYGYEYVLIGDEAAANGSPLTGFAGAAGGLMKEWMEAHQRGHTGPLDRVALISTAPDAPQVKTSRFVAAELPETRGSTFFDAEKAFRSSGRQKRNPVLAEYLIGG